MLRQGALLWRLCRRFNSPVDFQSLNCVASVAKALRPVATDRVNQQPLAFSLRYTMGGLTIRPTFLDFNVHESTYNFDARWNLYLALDSAVSLLDVRNVDQAVRRGERAFGPIQVSQMRLDLHPLATGVDVLNTENVFATTNGQASHGAF